MSADPESKIQKTADGFIQGYNTQVAVDGGPAARRQLHLRCSHVVDAGQPAQIIVAQHATPAAPDVNELVPAGTAITGTLRRKPGAVLADAGCWSEDNVEALAGKGIEAFIATGRQKNGEAPPPAPRGRPPKGLSVRDRMARKLRTVRGRQVYALRKTIVEPVFGQIKHARGFRQFLRRGVARVREEWALVCTAHNLVKLHAARAGTCGR